jgi:regulator of protease activity HflC (stomatin/prohibitin superfamily)
MAVEMGTALLTYSDVDPVAIRTFYYGKTIDADTLRDGSLLVVAVDLTEQLLDFNESFPAGDGGVFDVSIHVAYAVTDPPAVIERGIRDAPAILRPSLSGTIRRICRRYGSGECQEAEERIIQEIEDREQSTVPHDHAFRVTQPVVSVLPDSETRNFLRLRTEAERTAELRRSQGKAEAERLQAEAQFALEQHRWRAELAAETMRTEIEQHDLRSTCAERRAIEMRDQTAARIATESILLDRFLQLLSKERCGDLALMLLDNPPGGLTEVSNRLSRQRTATLEQQRVVFDQLLQHEAFDSPDMIEKAREVLSYLVQSLRTTSVAAEAYSALGAPYSDGDKATTRTPST